MKIGSSSSRAQPDTQEIYENISGIKFARSSSETSLVKRDRNFSIGCVYIIYTSELPIDGKIELFNSTEKMIFEFTLVLTCCIDKRGGEFYLEKFQNFIPYFPFFFSTRM